MTVAPPATATAYHTGEIAPCSGSGSGSGPIASPRTPIVKPIVRFVALTDKAILISMPIVVTTIRLRVITILPWLTGPNGPSYIRQSTPQCRPRGDDHPADMHTITTVARATVGTHLHLPRPHTLRSARYSWRASHLAAGIMS